MTEGNSLPDRQRRQTRATNANAHPGRVVTEVLAVHRNRDEIEKEKKAKNDRREAQERKKTNKQTAVKAIAAFENTMAVDDQVLETSFPRHQTGENAPHKAKGGSKKRKKQATKNTTCQSNKQPLETHQMRASELKDGFNTDVEASDDDRHSKLKRQKTLTGGHGAMPLYRTETYLRDENLRAPSPEDVPMPDLHNPAVIEIDDYTPRPTTKKKKKMISKSEGEGIDSQVESENDDFETPKVFKRKVLINFSDDNSDLEFANVTTAFADQEWVSESGSHDQNKEREDESDGFERESDDVNKKRKVKSDLQVTKTIDLTKVQNNAKKEKEKRAFRKEVQEKRDLVMKEESKAMTSSHNGDKVIQKETVSNSTAYNTSSGHEISDSKDGQGKSVLVQKDNNARPDIKRNSATSGNGIGIVRSKADAGRTAKPMGAKSGTATAENAGGLSALCDFQLELLILDSL